MRDKHKCKLTFIRGASDGPEYPLAHYKYFVILNHDVHVTNFLSCLP